MAYDAVQKWFKSRKYAQVNGSRVRPVEHPVLKGVPLSIQKGQAECVCLRDNYSSKWILKKFHKGKDLDRNYLEAVSSLLPRSESLLAGTHRQILSSGKLTKVPRCYYTRDLAIFLNNTILMPQITGTDWAGVADEIRQGHVQLSRSDRLELCMNLIDLIRTLEENNCAHRDLSSGNVFIVNSSLTIHLIDFDSFYHPSLRRPQATTCGTVGYTPPFAWQASKLAAKHTWCPYSDRYSLSILLTEFLILDKSCPLTAEGGMFDQDELCKRYGPGLNRARKVLKKEWPDVLGLFDSAISSMNFHSCPSPKDWQLVLGKMPEVRAKPPKLEQVNKFSADSFLNILKRKQTVSSQPVPRLSEIKPVRINLQRSFHEHTPLPPAPPLLIPSSPKKKPIKLYPIIESQKFEVDQNEFATFSPWNLLDNEQIIPCLPQDTPGYVPLPNSLNGKKYEKIKTSQFFLKPKHSFDPDEILNSSRSIPDNKQFHLDLLRNTSINTPLSNALNDKKHEEFKISQFFFMPRHSFDLDEILNPSRSILGKKQIRSDLLHNTLIDSLLPNVANDERHEEFETSQFFFKPKRSFDLDEILNSSRSILDKKQNRSDLLHNTLIDTLLPNVLNDKKYEYGAF